MLPIPDKILAPFDAFLEQKAIPLYLRSEYRKGLKYHLDFRVKYPPPDSKSEQVRLFIEKLRSKNQSQKHLEQAADALSFFFASQPVKKHAASAAVENAVSLSTAVPKTSGKTNRSSSPLSVSPVLSQLSTGWLGEKVSNSAPASTVKKTVQLPGRRYDVMRFREKTKSPEWDAIIGKLEAEITTRHYSRKTLIAYADWSRKFQSYLQDKQPGELSSADVKAYLTYLAVKCKVSSSTQNQAFNALLFLYPHILKNDFGEHKDIPRAKESNYIPIVLSRKEIDAALKHLSYPYDLVVKLLYGCGLRLFEGVKLRVFDFNFDAGILTVRGKGGKSRTVPIPQSIMPELLAQIETVKKLHDEDIAAGYAGVFLDDQIEIKYRNAARDFIWQWLFSQESLTYVAETKELRRYHLHDSHVQEALYEAVRKAKLTKRVTAHTFRHSFATALLQANYDIRTIQELLGHSDVRTTMIYTHCAPSKTLKETRSPLDF